MIYILDNLLSVAQVLAVILFMGNYLDMRRSSYQSKIAYASIGIIVVMALNSLGITIVGIASNLACALILAMLVYKKPRKRIIIACMAAFSIYMLCELIVNFLASLLMRVTNAELAHQDTTGTLLSVLELSIYFIVYWVVKSNARKGSNEEKPPFIAPSLRNILLPISLVLVGAFVLYSTTISPDSFQSEFGLAIYIVLLVTDVVLLFGSDRESKKYKLQNEITAMHLQNDLAEEIIKLQEQYLHDIRGQAHDFKKHVRHIESMLSTSHGEPVDAGMLKYVSDVVADLNKVDKASFPDISNKALRAILTKTTETCNKANVHFLTDIDYNNFSFMTYKDICAIFLNALENAITACEEIDDPNIKKYVSLDIKRSEDMIHISIANPRTGEIVVRNGELISTKLSPYFHGYGLKNIERIARQYGGMISMSHENGAFMLYINIPILMEST